jgi:hypothetical protein
MMAPAVRSSSAGATVNSADGACVDLVVDVEAMPDWHITDVRYWGFRSDRWHLDFDRGARLADQLAGLAATLPRQLGESSVIDEENGVTRAR